MTFIEKLGNCLETMYGRELSCVPETWTPEELFAMRSCILRSKETTKYFCIETQLPVKNAGHIQEVMLVQPEDGVEDEGL